MMEDIQYKVEAQVRRETGGNSGGDSEVRDSEVGGDSDSELS